MAYVVTRQDRRIPYRAFPLRLIAFMLVYGMLPILLLVHAATWMEQAVVFRMFGIPRPRQSDYILFDRAKLRRLNWVQRIGCIYCEYANGLIAWVKATINMLEVYSCAIKHSAHREGQEHQKEFSPYEKFL